MTINQRGQWFSYSKQEIRFASFRIVLRPVTFILSEYESGKPYRRPTYPTSKTTAPANENYISSVDKNRKRWSPFSRAIVS